MAAGVGTIGRSALFLVTAGRLDAGSDIYLDP